METENEKGEREAGARTKPGKVKIPTENGDVRSAVQLRVAEKVLFIVGWCAVVTVIAYFTGYLGDPVGMAFVEALWVFPFITTKIWRLFTTERAYEGVVTDVTLDNNVESKGLGLPVMGNIRRQTVTIKKDGGGLVVLKYVDSEDGERIEYAVGDRVRHYFGTQYLQKLGTEENICVICGTMCGEGEHVCSVCGKTIVGNFVEKTS